MTRHFICSSNSLLHMIKSLNLTTKSHGWSIKYASNVLPLQLWSRVSYLHASLNCLMMCAVKALQFCWCDASLRLNDLSEFPVDTISNKVSHSKHNLYLRSLPRTSTAATTNSRSAAFSAFGILQLVYFFVSTPHTMMCRETPSMSMLAMLSTLSACTTAKLWSKLACNKVWT